MRQFYENELESRVEVIRGWVNIDDFKILEDRDRVKSDLNLTTSIPIFLTSTELIPRSGLIQFIEVIEKVKQKGVDFKLIVEGEGVLREKLESLVRKSQLEETIKFWGSIKPDILPLLFGAVDAVILPTTHQEGFGLEALRAFACGRPVLSTPIGALMEILEAFQIQWLAADRDVRSLEKLMLAYLQDQITIFQPERIREILIEQGYSQPSGLQRLMKKVFLPEFKQDVLFHPDHYR